jgi:hypothetical protein
MTSYEIEITFRPKLISMPSFARLASRGRLSLRELVICALFLG